jgi:xanthine/uracil/vitamin C permease (AzgA family)
MVYIPTRTSPTHIPTLLQLFPKQVLLAGACGIGVFIAFVGFKDAGFISQVTKDHLLRHEGYG